jgi:hypothetical protein
VVTRALGHVWQGSFGLRLCATVPEEPEPEEPRIVASSGFKFILTGERKTTSMNSVTTVTTGLGKGPKTLGKGFAEGGPWQRALGKF